MGVRVVSGAEVRELLPMNECIDIMAETFRTLAQGQAVLPLRTAMWLPDRSGLLGLMPAWLGSPASVGLKVVTVMPGNHGTEYDAHQGAVLLFEVKHGSLLAIVDASAITAIRTAAASGVATRLLARQDAGDLAILGTGVQAGTHLQAMHAVRKLRRIRVWSRSHDNARAFAERESGRIGLAIEATATAQEAMQGADLVCTTTAAREPILKGAWLAAGAHINAVGACLASARELDTDAVARSRLFVDRRESTLHEAGDFLIPKQQGAFGDDHIAGEVGELLLGQTDGRRSPDELTLFKSLGIAVQDLAAAHYVYRRAIERRKGVDIDLGGRRTEHDTPES